ncbi:19483_t:CDS:1, partial [Gigaspora margarita]
MGINVELRGKTRDSSLDNRKEGFLRIATHNINRLKMHKHKIEILANWASVEKVNIIGISETNISKQKARDIFKTMSTYKGFWSESAEKKNK